MADVFVVDRAAFFGGRWPHGFVPASRVGFDLLERAASAGRFVPRDEAERTPAWKQWIPYCVLRCRAASDPKLPPEGIFWVRRTKGQSEARLHGLWSIGLGGHVEPEDLGVGGSADGAAFFARSLARELHEELHLDLPTGTHPHFLGLLNDDSTAVGAVHAGLVYALDLPMATGAASQAVHIREISKMSGGFGSLVDFRILWQDRTRFETWSQLLVDAGIAGPMVDSADAAR